MIEGSGQTKGSHLLNHPKALGAISAITTVAVAILALGAIYAHLQGMGIVNVALIGGGATLTSLVAPISLWVILAQAKKTATPQNSFIREESASDNDSSSTVSTTPPLGIPPSQPSMPLPPATTSSFSQAGIPPPPAALIDTAVKSTQTANSTQKSIGSQANIKQPVTSSSTSRAASPEPVEAVSFDKSLTHTDTELLRILSTMAPNPKQKYTTLKSTLSGTQTRGGAQSILQNICAQVEEKKESWLQLAQKKSSSSKGGRGGVKKLLYKTPQGTIRVMVTSKGDLYLLFGGAYKCTVGDAATKKVQMAIQCYQGGKLKIEQIAFASAKESTEKALKSMKEEAVNLFEVESVRQTGEEGSEFLLPSYATIDYESQTGEEKVAFVSPLQNGKREIILDMKPQEKIEFLRNVAKALILLHKHDISSNDSKIENTLTGLISKLPLLFDWDISTLGKVREIENTAPYICPQNAEYQKLPIFSKYCDLYSFAVFLQFAFIREFKYNFQTNNCSNATHFFTNKDRKREHLDDLGFQQHFDEIVKKTTLTPQLQPLYDLINKIKVAYPKTLSKEQISSMDRESPLTKTIDVLAELNTILEGWKEKKFGPGPAAPGSSRPAAPRQAPEIFAMPSRRPQQGQNSNTPKSAATGRPPKIDLGWGLPSNRGK